jgi:hypothetical protein
MKNDLAADIFSSAGKVFDFPDNKDWNQTSGDTPSIRGRFRNHHQIRSSVNPIDILPLDSRCLYQLMFTPGGTSVCLQRLPQPPVV